MSNTSDETWTVTEYGFKFPDDRPIKKGLNMHLMRLSRIHKIFIIATQCEFLRNDEAMCASPRDDSVATVYQFMQVTIGADKFKHYSKENAGVALEIEMGLCLSLQFLLLFDKFNTKCAQFIIDALLLAITYPYRAINGIVPEDKQDQQLEKINHFVIELHNVSETLHAETGCVNMAHITFEHLTTALTNCGYPNLAQIVHNFVTADWFFYQNVNRMLHEQIQKVASQRNEKEQVLAQMADLKKKLVGEEELQKKVADLKKQLIQKQAEAMESTRAALQTMQETDRYLQENKALRDANKELKERVKIVEDQRDRAKKRKSDNTRGTSKKKKLANDDNDDDQKDTNAAHMLVAFATE